MLPKLMRLMSSQVLELWFSPHISPFAIPALQGVCSPMIALVTTHFEHDPLTKPMKSNDIVREAADQVSGATVQLNAPCSCTQK